MMRRTIAVLGRSPYALFMSQVKSHPKLQGLPIAKRGKETAKLYRALSKAELAALKSKAAALPSFKRKPKSSKPRKAGPFALFVKKNFKSAVGKTNTDKIRNLAKLYKSQKK